MKYPRVCCKPGCNAPASVTLTYDYQDATAVIGYLSPQAVPGCYDLCIHHARRFRPARGWQVMCLKGVLEESPRTLDEELPQEVREAAQRAKSIQKPRLLEENISAEESCRQDGVASRKPLTSTSLRARFRVVEGEGK
ncbi:DUF3499 domain-containing protein [Actinomycetaceae bacterium TAE3-ERU4]|nr:DUF3499 domain-containing protein [Actinomycetaceae bacterium TAE3-ERU4]